MAAVSHFSGGSVGIDVSPPVALLQTTAYPAARPSVLTGGIGPAADYSRAAVATAWIATVPVPIAVPRVMPHKREWLTRTLECLPAAIAFFVISSLIWGPIFAPVPFAVCILSFHAYWLWRAQMTGIHAFKGYRLLKKHAKIDWRERYAQDLAAGVPSLAWDAIRHIVVIPNYT